MQQDPRYTARSISQDTIGIPQCAVNTSKDFRVSANQQPPTKKKRTDHGRSASIVAMSDDEDPADLALLLPEAGQLDGKGKVKCGVDEDIVVL